MTNIPEEDLMRRDQIADLINEIQKQAPGALRLATNPAKVSSACEMLARYKIKKPSLTSKEQFLIDAFLTNDEACCYLLLGTVLAGKRDEEGNTYCWNGLGNYRGWAGPLAVTDFARESNQKAIFVVNLEPVWPVFDGVLQPVQKH